MYFCIQITLKATVDAFGEDKDYLTPTTPLMYAARHNYHDIVKVESMVEMLV